MSINFNKKETYCEIIDRANKIDSNIEFASDSLIIHGDNFIAMAAMLSQYRKKIDLVYIDPPFNTDQIFSVEDNRVSTVSRSNNGKIAYSDNMTRDVFLKFMYERFVLIRELLSDEGSLYVHIDTKMGPYFRVMLDEIFGSNCFRNEITRIKTNPKNFSRKAYGNQKDTIYFYSKTKNNIWNDVRENLNDAEVKKRFSKIDSDGRRYTTIPIHAPGETSPNSPTGQPWRGLNPPPGRHWRTDPREFDRLDALGLIEWSSTGNPRLKKYADEHRGKKIQDIWKFKDPQYPIYPTEKNLDMLELIIKQSSKKQSLVMDCFAGSGTTMVAASKNDRRFIGIDNSDISIEIMRNRLENTNYQFVELTD